MREILQLDTSASVLRSKCRELTKSEILSTEIKSLINDMKETMRNAPGVGLAAPQIGLPLQLVVIEDSEERLKTLKPEILKDRNRIPVSFHVVINPKIIKLFGKMNYFFEGCLSVKNCARVTPRYDQIHVECLDENANKKVINASGWYARILQHETDHLAGKLCIDVGEARTHVEINDDFKEKWLNSTGSEIYQFYKEKCQ